MCRSKWCEVLENNLRIEEFFPPSIFDHQRLKTAIISSRSPRREGYAEFFHDQSPLNFSHLLRRVFFFAPETTGWSYFKQLIPEAPEGAVIC